MANLLDGHIEIVAECLLDKGFHLFFDLVHGIPLGHSVLRDENGRSYRLGPFHPAATMRRCGRFLCQRESVLQGGGMLGHRRHPHGGAVRIGVV